MEAYRKALEEIEVRASSASVRDIATEALAGEHRRQRRLTVGASVLTGVSVVTIDLLAEAAGHSLFW